MERIKFILNDLPSAKSNYDKKGRGIVQEVKHFLNEVDNQSFDYIRFKQKPEPGKFCIDVATGLKYPDYDQFLQKIQQSKYSSYFDLQ
ncbi:hypothetical protein N0B16_03525 [Chryseobacterium sp. GMJ5]|uniref:Uncharacterized protein n=1 Tax=Chryseobacterium gilvum TaxID=2976534 RepID=A0ABT2VU20_9FLAO|nr:hypothetical protein [Chryseobacterium gilvum]MCU7613497.1 hypothetical protein [Chryseobacterium gilvum]